MSKQIKDFDEITTLADGDWLLVQPSAGGVYKKITKANLLAGLSSGGSSTAWTPDAIGTYAWFDATGSSLTVDSSNLVSQWNDISGNARHLYQATSSRQPTKNATGLNNKPVVNFNGSNYIRASSSIDYGSNVSFFFVAKYNSSRIGLFDSAPGQRNVLRNNGDNAFEWWDNSPSLNIDCSVSEFNILNFNYQIISSIRTISKYVNGANFAQATYGTSDAAAWGQFTIGSINGSSPFLNGAIAEIILCAIPASPSIRQKIEGYLAWKWGLNSKLDSSHPYKTAFPTI